MARILVVDDEIDIVRMVAKVLTARGHQIEAGRDGVDAVERARVGALARALLAPPRVPELRRTPDELAASELTDVERAVRGEAEAGIDVATSCSKLQLRLIKDEAPHQESSNIELCPVAEVAGWPRPTAMSLVSGFQ